MAQIPPNTIEDPLAALATWKHTKEELQRLQLAERTMRAALFAHFFPSPKEGTNTTDLPAGWRLKGVYPVTRDIDEAALQGLQLAKVGDMLPTLAGWGVDVSKLDPAMPVLEAMNVNADSLIKRKPELAVSVYRKLTDVQTRVWDMCLASKPGSVSMEIVPPKAVG